MAAPTYNCPFSAASDQSDDALTCAEVLALNTNKGCMLYNSVDEHCLMRQFYMGMVNKYKLGDVYSTISILDYSGSIPLVIAQDYTQTSQAGAGTADVTGSLLTLADGWFVEGNTLKFTVGGNVVGANDVISIALYFESGAACTLTTANGAAGDWEAEFTIVAVDDTHQRIIGKLIAEAGAEIKIDYAEVNIDIAAAGTIPIKVQITSNNAGDTITAEYARIDYWKKAN